MQHSHLRNMGLANPPLATAGWHLRRRTDRPKAWEPDHLRRPWIRSFPRCSLLERYVRAPADIPGFFLMTSKEKAPALKTTGLASRLLRPCWAAPFKGGDSTL